MNNGVEPCGTEYVTGNSVEDKLLELLDATSELIFKPTRWGFLYHLNNLICKLVWYDQLCQSQRNISRKCHAHI